MRRYVFIVFVLAVLVIYPVLLLPHVIHVNLPNAGKVLSSGEISVDALPSAIVSLYLGPDWGSTVYYLIVAQTNPVRTDQPYQPWIMAVITKQSFLPGTLVEFTDPIVQGLFVDWRNYPFGQPFNELVVADLIHELGGIEALSESLLYSPVGGILSLISTTDLYVGPLLFPFLTIVFMRRLTFWSVILTVWGYAFGQQESNNFAIVHHISVPSELKLFGFSSYFLLAAAFLAWIYETKTEQGKRISKQVLSIRAN